MIPPLAIIQARLHSTRLPNKMLLDLGGHPLVWWAWNAAVKAFGYGHAVLAVPADDEGVFRDALPEATVFAWAGPEWDVLTRFWACAHTYRWHPHSVIVRVTADDPFKTPEALHYVAEGGRLPVEMGGEAFTLKQLDIAAGSTLTAHQREHITAALFRVPPSSPPPGVWTVDTLDDLEAARRWLAKGCAA